MIVCVCMRVSERDIEREVRDGCVSFDALQAELGVGRVCGSCCDCARATFADALEVSAPARAGHRGECAEACEPMSIAA
jgi:bacterioferritin-associated ferredoxin